MAETRAAHRYALALLQLAGSEKSGKTVEAVNKDFATIEALLKSSHDFSLFLRSPVINSQRKRGIFTSLFKEKLSDATYRFILLLTAKKREGILPEIIRQFYVLRDEQLGIEHAMVWSAVELTNEQEKKLGSQLEHATRKKVRLSKHIDRDLKGGVTVQIGDTVWDGSVRHQLEVLRELLGSVKV